MLLSVPHDGRSLPADIAKRMTAAGLALHDTDWHVAKLYAFAETLNASILVADYSRYVVDLNRSADDEALYENRISTGLCPEQTFAGDDIYCNGYGPDNGEIQARVGAYWQPYHGKLNEELQRIKADFGYALLWDAHSIPGEVPMLFDGQLPDLNVGTNNGCSCSDQLETAVLQVAEASDYSSVLNGRFRGGFITRNYGVPSDRVCAVQLELSQRCYMDEKTLRYDADRALLLAETIEKMMIAFVDAARNLFAR